MVLPSNSSMHYFQKVQSRLSLWNYPKLYIYTFTENGKLQ